MCANREREGERDIHMCMYMYVYLSKQKTMCHRCGHICAIQPLSCISTLHIDCIAIIDACVRGVCVWCVWCVCVVVSLIFVLTWCVFVFDCYYCVYLCLYLYECQSPYNVFEYHCWMCVCYYYYYYYCLYLCGCVLDCCYYYYVHVHVAHVVSAWVHHDTPFLCMRCVCVCVCVNTIFI